MQKQVEKNTNNEQPSKQPIQTDQKDDHQSEQNKKEPQTLSQGERMGLSKQQLRKLQKRLTNKKKKEEKEKQQNIKNVQKEEKKQEKKRGKEETKKVQIDQQYKKQFRAQKIHLKPNNRIPQIGNDNILITSALPYVNNIPHLGNIIGCVLSADVYSRFKKLQGSNVLYVCGTDEYGTATEVKAMEEGKTPKQICDYYYKIHNQVYKWFDIGFDIFGRTSTQWHTKITQQIFLSIHDAKKTMQKEMEQCYCQNCDLFLADRFIFGICPYCNYEDARGDQCDKCQKLFNSPTQLKQYFCHICKKVPIIRATTHFFINLTQTQGELQEWVNSASKKGEWSKNSIAITKAWLQKGLQPKCITRDLKWGVSVPIEGFQKKVFYVWFDAPIGYISITANLLQQDYKRWWINENDNVKLYQFMGKDNVPFHTVVFPSSLIASQQKWNLIHHISTTEYLNYESGKFSKRNGTGIFGTHAIELENDIASQVWRYYLLVNRPEKSDSEFSWKDFMDKNNNELLENLGNLVNRVLQFIYKYQNKRIPKRNEDLWGDAEEQFIAELQSRYQKYKDILNKVEIKQGLKFCMQISSRGNKYLQESKFWQKNNRQSGKTLLILNTITNFIRFQSFLIEPYMPSTSAKINYLLGIQDSEEDRVLGKILNEGNFKQTFTNLIGKSQFIRQPIPLFTKFSEQQIGEWRERFKGILKQQ